LHPHDDEGRGQSRSGSRPNSSKRPPLQPQSDNQPGTSSYVDSNLEGRRRKDRDRERPTRDDNEYNTDMMRNSCKIGASPVMKRKNRTERENGLRFNERAVDDYPQKTK
jgi:hypothetical protein